MIAVMWHSPHETDQFGQYLCHYQTHYKHHCCYYYHFNYYTLCSDDPEGQKQKLKTEAGVITRHRRWESCCATRWS